MNGLPINPEASGCPRDIKDLDFFPTDRIVKNGLNKKLRGLPLPFTLKRKEKIACTTDRLARQQLRRYQASGNAMLV
jgi:hypothetical protein